jgi:hypothetical protein
MEKMDSKNVGRINLCLKICHKFKKLRSEVHTYELFSSLAPSEKHPEWCCYS